MSIESQINEFSYRLGDIRGTRKDLEGQQLDITPDSPSRFDVKFSVCLDESSIQLDTTITMDLPHADLLVRVAGIWSLYGPAKLSPEEVDNFVREIAGPRTVNVAVFKAQELARSLDCPYPQFSYSLEEAVRNSSVALDPV